MTPSSLVMPSLGPYALLALIVFVLLQSLSYLALPIPGVLTGIVGLVCVLLAFIH